MKTKPTKHKEENTFKFQSFSERLSSINVDVVHRVDLRRNAVPEETETFFYECLGKWSDLNCTEGYTKFCKQLGRDVQSLAQLLLHQDHVTDLLYQHIHHDNALYLEPLLELLVAVVKDIQSDFYPKFPTFFARLVDLLQTKDAQIVEWTFTTLAFLYKYQWRALVKDISNVYKLQLPLLASDKPEHVQLFASESFAFIGRKITNKPAFVDLIFSKLRANSQDSLGVGQLLFQVIKGVKNQFHSNLDVYLPLYLSAVAAVDFCVKDDPIFLAVEHCFLLMARHTTAAFSTLVWKLLLKEVTNKQPGTVGVLLILNQWINFREGGLVEDSVSIANALAALAKEDLNEEEQITTAETIASLVMCSKMKLPLEQFSRLGLLLFSSGWNAKAIFGFSAKVATHELFESHLLPHYLSFCHSVSKMSCDQHEELLSSLSHLIATKTTFPKSGNEVEQYKLYPMEFTFAMRKSQDSRSVPHIIEEALQKNNIGNMVNEQFKLLVSALVCLPSVKPINDEKVKALLKGIIGNIIHSLEKEEGTAEEPKSKRRKTSAKPVDFSEQLGFIASLVILNGSHLFSSVLDMTSLESILSLLRHERSSRNVFFLRAADFYLTTLHRAGHQELFTYELLNQLYRDIGENISSPYRETRILTLHILSLFTLPLPTPPENTNPLPVFDICLQGELIPAGLREHRDKLKVIQNLDSERVARSLPTDGTLNKVPLQFLFSQLFINFRPLWEPILKLIESHAAQMDPAEFWSVYFPFLRRVRQEQASDIGDPTSEIEYLQLGVLTERLDFVHVRCLLWQGLSRFGTVIEKQQALIVQQFLEFWNEEYCATDSALSQYQNLYRVNPIDDEANDEDENNENEEESGSKCSRKKLIQLLTAHLGVVGSFRNPLQMTREAEVTSILYNLLTHRLPEVQKQALDCLSAYELPDLTPYKENLQRLMDDKTFRSELTLFSIDSSSSLVRPEHRPGLTRVLMRLLFGKMQSKAGHNSAGKQSVQQRQSLILRYLAGFSDSEMDEFLLLAFQKFHSYHKNDDIYQRVVQLMKEANPSVAHPLKRLQGALVMMGTIFAKLGNLMKSTVPKLLQVLLCICAHVSGLLEKRSAIDPKYLTQLKNLRTLSLERVTQFFTKFERYPWTPEEVEALFHVCIWPQLELLPIECIHSPTPLLRLFQVWALNPRYFVLFSKRHPEREVSILPPMLTLLTGGKAQPAVCSFIMDIVDKLVTLADYGAHDPDEAEDSEMMEEPVFIKPNFCLGCPAVSEQKAEKEMPNFGSTLLIPHISPVLHHLRGIISRGLNARDLNVLMRLSEFISDSNLSSELSQLMVPAIKAKSEGSRGQGAASEEILTQYLNSLSNLLLTANDPHNFLGLLAPLFGSVDGRSAREALSNTIRVIGGRDASYASVGEMVSALNSWDRRRVDEPDYDARLKVHKEINATLAQKAPPPVEWVYLVMYNCFHFVRKVADSSLKDSASFSLQQIAAALERVPYGRNVLNQHFLPQLRVLIRSKNEDVRHEGVLILGETVGHCGTLHSALGCLRKLRKPGDVELDFFENSRHLQTHRRSRALLRLTSVLKSDRTAFSEDSITQFLLPLTTCYLFDKNYDTHNHLVDASFECIQAIARCLSWYSYDKLLRFFLTQMTRQVEFQRQSVKAVVAVLNGFHFNLKSSQFKSGKPQIETVTEDVSLVDTSNQPSDAPAAQPVDELPEMENEEERKTMEKAEQSVETATRIHSIIVQQLLPQLNRILTARSKRDAQHKAVKDHFPEDDEILRVPIALALVHLLKNLPPGALERNLPGMFSKVITFLKSRCDSVRETSRDTLIRMMTALGPAHLPTLFEAAEPILQRGFQVHVYIYTAHAILVKMVEVGHVKAGTLDPVVHQLVAICKKELLGDTAEEKEVAQIVSKVKEARGIKAYDTLNITAKYVSQTSLLSLIRPFKELMASTKSFKLMRKVEECLQNISTGLAMNQALPIDQLLIFIHGVVTLSIPELKLPEERSKSAEDGLSANGKPLRHDSFIIAAEPKRKSAAQPVATAQASKSAYVTNSHLLVEFGFLTLQLALKQDACKNKNILPMLDPFVPIVNDSLRSQHSKLVVLALRCICRLLRMSLPSIDEYTPKIATSIFTLLHKYSGNASGDTFEMIQTAFKAVTVIVKHVTSHMIDTDQLRVLLTYAEQALNDPTQQSIGFGVLKSILRRKLTLEELPEIMYRVSQLSITSEAGPVRAQCKQVVLQYLIDYPLGKKILRYLEFFLAQLEYEKEIGRLSAIEFLVSVFKTFPKNLLSQQSTLFLVTMSPRLINDDSESCRKAVTAALRILIQRLNTKTSNVLFEICMTWLKDSNVSHKRLAVELCGIFAAAECAKFEFRMKELLPEFIQLLEPPEEDDKDRDMDLLVIKTFFAISKIVQLCPIGLRNPDYVDLTDDLWTRILQHLLHPHEWVRTCSAKLIGTLFGWHKAEEVAACVSNQTASEEINRSYLLCPEHVAARLRSLASALVGQLQAEQLKNDLAEQIVRNLIFIAKVANRLPPTNAEQELGTTAPTLPWLTGKLRREINAEVALRSTEPIKRLSVFKWMGAVAVDLNEVAGKEALTAVLKFFVPPLTREINDDGAPEEVRNLAQEVADLIKGLVGTETYSEAAVTATRNLAVRRRDRIAARKADSVVRPERTAQLRIKKHLAKRLAKKVKIAKLKGRKLKLKKPAKSS